MRFHRSLRWFSRDMPPEPAFRGLGRVRACLPIRMAWHFGGSVSLIRRAHLRKPCTRIRVAQHAVAIDYTALPAVCARRRHGTLAGRAYLAGIAHATLEWKRLATESGADLAKRCYRH